VKDLEVMETVGSEEVKDVLALFKDGGKAVLRRLKRANGDVAWEYNDSSDDVPL
jgi:hypothetical protein